MTELSAIIARAAPEAGARIGGLREAHLAALTPLVEKGAVRLAVPLLDEAGAYRGTLVLVAPEAVWRYLEGEPFRAIWASHEVRPFRLAAMPWAPLPSGPTPASPTHVVAFATDGTDPEAPARRLAARPRHLARVGAAVADGTLALGGAFLDAPGGGMAGSLALTRHASVEAARAWWGEDPYVTEGVWREVEWHATRFAPLPYQTLA